MFSMFSSSSPSSSSYFEGEEEKDEKLHIHFIFNKAFYAFVFASILEPCPLRSCSCRAPLRLSRSAVRARRRRRRQADRSHTPDWSNDREVIYI